MSQEFFIQRPAVTPTIYAYQLVNGDTEAAANKANQAIVDMADNANKMGTDMSMIQSAYQGFAKQNYTMLDNLKLGYGGTKTEMERLLADASEIAGVEFSIESYADIVDAIHIIQTQMGITGTTAKEAEYTITGSINSLKSALQNLIAGFGNSEADIQGLCENVVDGFQTVVKNITPIIGNIISALPTAVDALIEAVADLLPTFLTMVTDLFDQVLETLLTLLPSLVPAVMDALLTIVNTLIKNLPLIINVAAKIITSLASGIAKALPKLIPTIVQAVIEVCETLIANLPLLLDTVLEIIEGLVEGILDAIPIIIDALPEIILAIIDFILEAIPQIIETGIKLFTSLIDALPEIIEAIVEAIPIIIDGIINAIVENLPLIIGAGINLFVTLIQALGVDSHKGYVKVGYTDRNAETRIREQLHVSGIRYQIVLEESAMRSDGTCFSDHDVHAVLRRKGFRQLNEGEDRNEWFCCSASDVKSAVLEVRDGLVSEENRSLTFQMRPEQTVAVQKTMAFFQKAKEEDPQKPPKFLWNAKMRFGKTFATYQLAKRMGVKRVLVLTFKPAVESAWRDDLLSHVDFEGWQFVSNKDAHDNKTNMDVLFEQADKSRPIVVFGSFQDLLGTNENGGIKAKNEFIHTTNWDIVVFDEYHFGAWRENAKKLFENVDEEENADFDAEQYKQSEADNAYNESFLPITTGYYLFLSGTPFRAINSGEFIEDQIYNWTYSDEQSAKERWIGSGNPYLSLPRMVMMTYRIPDSIRQIAVQGEFDEFDLNVFFSAKGKGDEAKFVYENEVQKWLDLIRGSYLPSSVDDLKLGQDKRPPMPFSDTRLLNVLSHTLWFLPDVASCFAMANLLKQKQNVFYHDYKINVCAGVGAGVGLDALRPVQQSMGNPLETKTITLSCGKLTTGVTVKPWTGIFMLRNLKSPETYFQAAFRVQSPWEVLDDNGKMQIVKKECYVFDFALDRALRQISDYSCRLNVEESNPEKKVADFIHFLPVLAYDGSTMKQINAQDVLDIAMAGTSATLLAKRWESALLVNVDNDTLSRLLNNKDALEALMRIEGFRSLNQDITTIINKSDAVKKAKKEAQEKLTAKEKKEISEEEKEYKSLRKQIQEKLIKFATRVPIFMYLTDYRERSWKDVITQLEPGLFKKVTGLDVNDFNLLCSIGVFNASLMNDAIFKFKRYEDSSLSYTGIEKNVATEIGGWDTVIRREEYRKLFFKQQSTMSDSQ